MLLSMSPDSHDLDPQQPGELTRTLFLPKANPAPDPACLLYTSQRRSSAASCPDSASEKALSAAAKT